MKFTWSSTYRKLGNICFESLKHLSSECKEPKENCEIIQFCPGSIILCNCFINLLFICLFVLYQDFLDEGSSMLLYILTQASYINSWIHSDNICGAPSINVYLFFPFFLFLSQDLKCYIANLVIDSLLIIISFTFCYMIKIQIIA